MTGGCIIVLGKTGINFAAGMSGGTAFVLDESQLFDTRCNLEMVDLESVTEPHDIEFLQTQIRKHFAYTKSPLAKHILENWQEYLPFFVKVMPVDYRRALQRMEEMPFKDEGTLTVTEEVYN